VQIKNLGAVVLTMGLAIGAGALVFGAGGCTPKVPTAAPDLDADGVPDAVDKCPGKKEDGLDPDPKDGCPKG
jgi:hypothetical protein